MEIVLHEGKKRQIRLMFQSVGIRVIDLHRKKYGPLDLRGLTPGQKRPLTVPELQALKNMTSSHQPGQVFRQHQIHARQALQKLRAQAANKGLDQLGADEIEEIIRKTRKARET